MKIPSHKLWGIGPDFPITKLEAKPSANVWFCIRSDFVHHVVKSYRRIGGRKSRLSKANPKLTNTKFGYIRNCECFAKHSWTSALQHRGCGRIIRRLSHFPANAIHELQCGVAHWNQNVQSNCEKEVGVFQRSIFRYLQAAAVSATLAPVIANEYKRCPVCWPDHLSCAVWYSDLSATPQHQCQAVWSFSIVPSQEAAALLFLALLLVLERTRWRHWCNCDAKSWQQHFDFVCVVKHACTLGVTSAWVEIAQDSPKANSDGYSGGIGVGIDRSQQLEGLTANYRCVKMVQPKAVFCD